MQEFENSPPPDHKQYIRKVTLPSGKTIEVISFEDLAPRAEPELHVCPDCTSRPRLPRRLGRGRPRALGGQPALPQLRVDASPASSRRTRSSASTTRSTAAPRRSSPTCASSRGRTWKRTSSASSPRSPPGTSSPRTSRLAARSGVAVDDRVGHEVQRQPLAVLELERRQLAPSPRRRSPAPAPAPRRARPSPRCARTAPSACSRRRDRRAGRSRRASASRSRARISGSVTVPSSRSVPRCLPVRAAGPETSSTSSSSWKARPMRRPNAPSAATCVAPRAAPRARRARTPPRTGARSSARSDSR